MSYTGLGRVGEVEMSDWMRKVVRGESRTVDETLIFLREKATERFGRDLARAELHHSFCIGAFLAGRAWAVMVSNVHPRPPFNALPPLEEFQTSALLVENEPLVLAWGSGRAAIKQAELGRLTQIVRNRPKSPKNYSKLLATVNRRAAQVPELGSTVSESCFVAHIPPQGDPVGSEFFGWETLKPPRPPVVPMVLFGIDTTEMTRVLVDNLPKMWEANAPDEEIRAALERWAGEAGTGAVTPSDD
jgi:hypothetical protein